MIVALVFAWGVLVGMLGGWLWVARRMLDALDGSVSSASAAELELLEAVFMALLPDWFWRWLRRSGRAS